jgi:hypothetical protein
VFAAVGDNAVLISNTRAGLTKAIDVRSGNGDSMADSEAFKDAMARLPEDNLAVGYVDGGQLALLAQTAAALAPAGAEQAGQLAQMQQLTDQLKAIRSIAFSASAEDDGARFRAVAAVDKGEIEKLGLGGSEPFDPALDERVPADAIVYVSFKDLGPQLWKTVKNFSAQVPNFDQQVQMLQAQTGVNIEDDLIPLLSGEHALYLRGSTPPSGALLLAPEDAAKGAATIQKLTTLAALGGVQGLKPLASGEGQQADVDGQAVFWRRDGDVIALGAGDLTAGSEPDAALSDDADYKATREAAGVPDETSTFFYADVPGIAQLAESTGEAMEPEAKANLEHVGGVVGWATIDDDSASTDLFVHVK